MVAKRMESSRVACRVSFACLHLASKGSMAWRLSFATGLTISVNNTWRGSLTVETKTSHDDHKSKIFLGPWANFPMGSLQASKPSM